MSRSIRRHSGRDEPFLVPACQSPWRRPRLVFRTALKLQRSDVETIVRGGLRYFEIANWEAEAEEKAAEDVFRVGLDRMPVPRQTAWRLL